MRNVTTDGRRSAVVASSLERWCTGGGTPTRDGTTAQSRGKTDLALCGGSRHKFARTRCASRRVSRPAAVVTAWRRGRAALGVQMAAAVAHAALLMWLAHVPARAHM